LGRIKYGLQDKLYLGNLDAKRDWGFAGDYVKAMWMMLQHTEPGDFVVATGESYSVREFLEVAFSYVGLDWQKFVEVDPKYFRPTEVDYLMGDSTKARKALGWAPETTFKQLVQMMVDSEMLLAQLEKAQTAVLEAAPVR
jgi:GDPmannose 4,6-dehydratase